MNYLLRNLFLILFCQLVAGRTIKTAINETEILCDCSPSNSTLCEHCTAICGGPIGAIKIDGREETKRFITITSCALLLGVFISGTIFLSFHFLRKKSAHENVESQEQPIEELEIHEIKSDDNETVNNETKDNEEDQKSHSESIVQDDKLDEVSLSD